MLGLCLIMSAGRNPARRPRRELTPPGCSCGSGGWGAAHAPVATLAQLHLPRVIRAVGEPNGDRVGAERLPHFDDVPVVLHRLTPHRSIGVATGAELVAQRLARLVLERVRVDGVESEAELGGEGAQRRDVMGLVPGDVERDAWRGPG